MATGGGRRVAISSGAIRPTGTNEIVAAQVLPGLLEPADLAPLYLFLGSEGAKDMTGQAVMLDRGEVMA